MNGPFTLENSDKSEKSKIEVKSILKLSFYLACVILGQKRGLR